MKITGFLLGILLAAVCIAETESPNIGRFAEYHITPYDLVTFSREAAQVRLCTDCAISPLSIDSDSGLFERQSEINLKRATELYLSKPYSIIFIGVDRQQKRVDYIRFGGLGGDY